MCSRCIIRSIIKLSLRTLTVGHLLPPTTIAATTTATVTITLHHYQLNSRLPLKRPKDQSTDVDDNGDHNNNDDDDDDDNGDDDNRRQVTSNSTNAKQSISEQIDRRVSMYLYTRI